MPFAAIETSALALLPNVASCINALNVKGTILLNDVPLALLLLLLPLRPLLLLYLVGALHQTLLALLLQAAICNCLLFGTIVPCNLPLVTAVTLACSRFPLRMTAVLSSRC